MEEIPLFRVFVSPNASDVTGKTLHSGYITQGPRVEEFEKKLEQYLENPYTLALNSATSAHHLALHLLKKPSSANKWPGLKEGDEILSTALTCTATNFPILANGFKIKWVDVDPRTGNMDVRDLRKKITKNTKVIVFVHWGGTPADLDGVKEVQDYAERAFGFRPMVIEDAAHAMGAEYRGVKIGALQRGNIATFSLQAIKHLTTSDGGVLCLPNEELYERAKLLRWYGIDREKRNYQKKDFRLESDVAEYGFKFHMNDWNASLGLANFPFLAQNLERHRANAQFYNESLKNTNGIKLIHPPNGANSSYWVYSLFVENKPEFIEHMKSKGIVASQVHARNDTHSVCAPFRAHLPNLDAVEKELVAIPCGWWITDEQREYIVHSIRDFFHHRNKNSVAISRKWTNSTNGNSVPRHVARRKIIITGGCGFIGHHVVEHFSRTTDCDLVVIDKLSYASLGYDRLRDTGVIDRVQVFATDLVNGIPEGVAYELGNRIEFIVHMAAETHVDNSIKDPVPFMRNNVESTISILEYTRNLIKAGCDLKSFFYFSTDEVFGPALGTTMYEEWDRHKPTNPYSASKSAAENICISYENTYKIPLMIVNVMNAFGERQHPEKFIPKCTRKVLAGETVHIHSYPDKRRAGTRFYIHARNIAAAVGFLLQKGSIGEKYNITGEKEVDNLELATFISKVCEKPLIYEMVDHHADRPGHDLRYGLSGVKMAKMGWVPPYGFEASLTKCIKWTLENRHWLELKRWAEDPNVYEGISPEEIGQVFDPTKENPTKGNARISKL
jgi:dTDP-glucose 4,6-dehydratase